MSDLAEIAMVAVATGQAGEGAGADPRYSGHLLESGRLVVATDGDALVGYAATVRREDADLLSDLFVLPERHGEGVGKALLDQVWTDAPHRMTFSSAHPSALPLYLRYGLTPRWPVLYLVGDPSALPASQFSVEDIDAQQACAIEAELGGGDRKSEYAYWAARPNARLIGVLDGGREVAVGALGGDGSARGLSHLRVRKGSAAGDSLLAALAGLAGSVVVAAPGPIRGVDVLLNSGWRIVDIDQFCSSRPGIVDPEVVFPHSGLL